MMMMLLGSSGAMVISSLSVLLLTHYVGPEVYGIYQAVDALAMIFAVGGLFAVDKAFFISRSRGEDERIVAIGLVALGCSCIVALGVLWLLIEFGGMLDGGMSIMMGAYLLFSIFSRGLFSLARSYHIRDTRYRKVYVGELMRAIGLLVGRTVAAFTMPNLMGLLLSGLFGSFSGTHRIVRDLYPYIRSGFRKIGDRRFRAMAFKHRRFLLLEGWGGFMRPLGQRGIIILVAPLFGPQQAAIASMAFLLLLQPLQIAVNAVVDVVRSRLGLAMRGVSMKGDLRYARLMPIWVIGITPLALIAGITLIELLSPIILGDGWQDIGTASMSMAALIYGLMIARALQSVYSQFSRQDMALLIDSTMSIGSLSLIFLFWLLGLPIRQVYFWTGLSLLLFLSGFLIHFYLWKKADRGSDEISP
ncbi:hypothetical protein [Martelella sp. HB161492]|uniref:lipopolysaccharide biosynthesis protein n=1 Tax=Martelella sp. HB161492 TaxID=2720726 RepID=UPI00159089C7|nr:hypothetical protein [Martelella sp. HB161492]